MYIWLCAIQHYTNVVLELVESDVRQRGEQIFGKKEEEKQEKKRTYVNWIVQQFGVLLCVGFNVVTSVKSRKRNNPSKCTDGKINVYMMHQSTGLHQTSIDRERICYTFNPRFGNMVSFWRGCKNGEEWNLTFAKQPSERWCNHSRVTCAAPHPYHTFCCQSISCCQTSTWSCCTAALQCGFISNSSQSNKPQLSWDWQTGSSDETYFNVCNVSSALSVAMVASW